MEKMLPKKFGWLNIKKEKNKKPNNKNDDINSVNF